MGKGRTKNSDSKKVYHFKLFVAGDEPNSCRTMETLQRFCESHLRGKYKLEVVVVFEDYKSTLENNILLVPTLIVKTPNSEKKVVGPIDDEKKILKVLGTVEAVEEGVKKKKLTYEELETRLNQAEEALRAIRSGEVDVIVGEKSPLVLKSIALEEALKASEEKYRALVEKSLQGIIVVQNFRIVYANERCAEITGYRVEELLSLPTDKVITLIHPEDQPLVWGRFKERLEGKDIPPRYEYRIIRKNGSILWVEMFASLIEYQGKPAIQAAIIDIHEKKRAEETLKFERDQLLSLFDSINQAIYVTDPKSYEVLFANQHLRELLGKDPVGGFCYREFQGMDHPCEFCTNDIILKLKGQPYRWEYHNPILNRDYEITDRIIKWPDEREVRFEIAIDITERKQTEEALQESEKRFKELFDYAPVGYHEIDMEGRITNVNKRELEMLGYDFEEMMGHFIWEFVLEEETFRKNVIEKLAGEIPPGKSFEWNYRRKDGSSLPVLTQDRILRNQGGKITGIRSTIQDIVELKRKEQEILSLQEQLRQAQKMEAIGRLAGGIAHDFNNILSVILGTCQISFFDIREGDPLHANFKEIEQQANRAVDLTRQLLAFSRKQMMDMRVVDLNDVVKDLEKILKRIIGEDIELVSYLSENLWSVRVDPSQIEQVIINIVVNARDAMPHGGKLTIETANVELDEEYTKRHLEVTPGPYVMLSISDTGVGMTKEVQEKIFEPFFTTKEMGRGTGLGLSTVYGIVKQFGGNIWVYSEVGKGSTFKIYLPRVEEPLDEVVRKEVIGEIPRGSETILVVEDEEVVRKLAVKALKKQGYKVLDAPDGGQALILCEKYQDPIHLILTDVVMPGINGRELVERLKRIHPEMKALYMSGYTDNVVFHHGILEQELAFIQKPFTLENLGRKVREVLDKR